MFGRSRKQLKCVLCIADSILVSLAFYFAYQTRFQLNFDKIVYWLFYINLPEAILLLLVSILCWLALGYWFDIYDKLDSAHARVVVRDTFRQCALGGVCLVLAEYTLRLDLSRFFVALFAIYAWILLCLFRINSGRLIHFAQRRFGPSHFVMIVGSNKHAYELGRALEQSSEYGIRLVGFFSDRRGVVQLSKAYDQYPLGELPELIRERIVDEIIFSVETDQLREMEKIFLVCDEQGIRTRLVLDFFPHLNSKMYLDRLGTNNLLTFTTVPHDEIRLLVKRLTDVLLAAAGLILMSPFMALIALVIKLSSRGPAIFRQNRCGLNGRPFTFYKFRSMCYNAEELKPSLMHLNRKSKAFKIPDDPRLTRVGRFLRKFSIDEWPQLWNVLKGDMSLVGPRPAVPEEVAVYETWQRRRLRMRPGLTCLWAIAGRDNLDFDTWMKLDMQYIDSWSLELDWEIMLRTVPRILTAKGAN